MGRRYEQDLTRDFDGRIDEATALALGHYDLVSTTLLVHRLAKLSKAIRASKSPLGMSINEFVDASATVDEEVEIARILKVRSPRRVERARHRHPARLLHIPGIPLVEPESAEEIRG